MCKNYCIVIIGMFASLACPAGPTPERVGFNYPEAGIRFSPRRHVVSDTVRGTEAISGPSEIKLLFPRTTSLIEGRGKRLLTTGIVGSWDNNQIPLYDEISLVLFGAEKQYDFELVDEKPIDLPWRGLNPPTGIIRVFKMTPVTEKDVPQYTFAVYVNHYENTIEFMWRDSAQNPPDDEKMQEFFYWTWGMTFFEPKIPENAPIKGN
ncbi:MAG: hypothetical protein ABIC40_08965 [bacterium]